MIPGALHCSMYRPTNELTKRLVIVRTPAGHLPGMFTGETGKFGEHFEIEIDDWLADYRDVDSYAMYHYEDIYASTEENRDRLF